MLQRLHSESVQINTFTSITSISLKRRDMKDFSIKIGG